jgi:hypothetical protein
VPSDAAEVWVQYLERDLAVVLEVFGQVDRTLPATPELAYEAVAVAEPLREPCRDLAHDGPGDGRSNMAGARGSRQNSCWRIDSTAGKLERDRSIAVACATAAVRWRT